MSASKRLKALEFTQDGQAKNPDMMYDLFVAWPQLVAVVVEAERQVAESHTDDVDLELAASLAALEEALS